MRHRDFYSTCDTFISVMLSYGEPAKQISEYCGTSVTMIEDHYGKWIRDSKNFGAAALAGKRPEQVQGDLFAPAADVEHVRKVVNALDYLKDDLGGRKHAQGEKNR